MLAKKSISAPIIAICISLNSANLFAAEESISSMFPVWPFFAILFVILIFRKQLNCVPPLALEDEPVTDNPPEQTIAEPAEPEAPATAIAEKHITPEVSETETSAPIAIPEPEPEASPETEDNVIDLKDDSQCQGSTAKGTRCKRKSALTDASITIDGITYLLSACRQHNNDQLKPYAGLIK